MFFGYLTLKNLIILCICMFCAGFVDSIAGGGGCISLPAFMISGLPVQNAFACNKIGAFLGNSVSAANYIRAKKFEIKTGIISAIFGLVFSNIASTIAVHLDPNLFNKLLVIVMPFAAIFILIKKDFGNENNFQNLSKTKAIIFSIVIGISLGLYDGIIGPGTGTFAIMMFSALLKLDLKTASGNAKILNWCTGLGSCIAFIKAGKVIWGLALLAAFCDILGSIIGSSLALKKEPVFIRVMMAVAAFLIIIKLMIDIF